MKRILCYGDSNTHGCNPAWIPAWDEDPEKTVRFSEEIRWTCVLQKLLGEKEYRVIEEGLPGRTTVFPDPVYPHCNGKDSIYPCILSHSPIDLLVIMLGTNDIKVSFHPCVDMAVRAMEELLKVVLNPYIWEHRRVPKLLLVAPVPVRDQIETSNFWGMYDRNSVELSRQLGGVYETLAERYGCHFLNAGDYAEASELDSIHLDEENHRKLAEALEEKIRGIFEKQ